MRSPLLLMSVLATCAQQGRSVWEYLNAAVSNYFAAEASPSLLGEG